MSTVVSGTVRLRFELALELPHTATEWQIRQAIFNRLDSVAVDWDYDPRSGITIDSITRDIDN